MIHSSALEGHHFLVSRRRGYDPAEVDAVIARLVAALREHEERAAAPQSGSPAVADLHVIRPEPDSDQAGQATAEQALAEAQDRLASASRESAARLADAEEQAAHIVEMARAEAAHLMARRNARAEELITSALSEVKALRSRVLRETNEYGVGKRTEASALLRTAQLQAEQTIEDARHEAGSILGRARREHMMLEQRIGQLRSAVAGIEGQFRNLAETTLEQTEIMSSMLSLETTPLDEVLEDAAAETEGINDEPEVVRLTQGGLTIDLTADAEEAAPADEPTDEHFAVAPGSTIYQRRGGGLRRRLEEEEVEELPERSD